MDISYINTLPIEIINMIYNNINCETKMYLNKYNLNYYYNNNYKKTIHNKNYIVHLIKEKCNMFINYIFINNKFNYIELYRPKPFIYRDILFNDNISLYVYISKYYNNYVSLQILKDFIKKYNIKINTRKKHKVISNKNTVWIN
jgi:hypothetical protein